MDPALSELSSIYTRGDLVLFVGAGVSAAAGLPSWGKLVAALIERARVRGVSGVALDEITALAGRNELIDALTALRDSLGAGEFCAVVEQLCDDSGVDDLPDVVKAIGALRGLRAVLTTNLDHLLERAFSGAWPAMARATMDIAQRKRFILKLHGTRMDRSTWVFTRDEYDRAMHADETLKQAYGVFFNACTLLFVGYGLADDDFNAVLGRVRALTVNQAPRHFALVDAQTITPFRKSKLQGAGVQLIPYQNPDGRHTEVTRILRELGGAVTAAAAATAVVAAPPAATPALTATAVQVIAAPPATPRVPLPQPEIHKIHAAAVRLGLGRSRAVLLGGVDLTVTAALPSAGDPAGQLLSDLHALNGIGVLADGTAPLAAWLANATALAGVRAESAVFKSALSVIEGR